MSYRIELVKAGNLESYDIVIALMGPTGSGKSQIIDTLTGQKTRAGTGLKFVTDEVTAHRVLGHPKYADKLVLVDTPGFDDTNKSDKQILEMISRWMTKTYKRRACLAGILYIHRIADVRMSGTPHRNLRMFKELCGDKFATNIVLLTTMWDKARSPQEAERREARLKERYWNVMIHYGASVERFYVNGSGPKSPWLIVDKMIQRHHKMIQLRSALLLQEEMVDVAKQFNSTTAGKALFRDLGALLEKQNKTIKSLEEQMDGGRMDIDVQMEMEALRSEFENIVKELERMKTLGGRITLFFGKALGRKSDRIELGIESKRSRARGAIPVDEQTARSESRVELPLEFQMSSMHLSSTTTSFSFDSRIPPNSRNRTMKLPSPVVEQVEEAKEEVKPEPQSEEKHSLLGAPTRQVEKIMVRDEPDLRTTSFPLDSRIPPNSRNRTMKLPSPPVVEQVEEAKEEVKPEPQSEEKHSLLSAPTRRAEKIMVRDKPDLRSVEEHFPSDAAMEQAKETKDKVEAKPRGEEEHPLSDTVMDEGQPNLESEEERLLSDATMEQSEGVKDDVKADPPDRSEHLESDALLGWTAIKDAVKPEPQSGDDRSLLDEGELGWEDELPKSRKARCKPAARKTGGRNPKAVRWNRSRRVDPIGQLAEVVSCLPLEGVEGGLQLTVNVNVTNIHGNFHAAAASTAPNVNNISITNTNSSNAGTFAQDASEVDSDEDDDNETEA